jgi:predicted transposase YbfD/YdcC
MCFWQVQVDKKFNEITAIPRLFEDLDCEGGILSRVRNDNGPMNLNIFRKNRLFLLTHEPSKISLKRKRKKAPKDNSFLIEILKSA